VDVRGGTTAICWTAQGVGTQVNKRAKPGQFERGAPIETLAGTVERVTFHNAKTGFCVLKVQARGKRDLVPGVGQPPREVLNPVARLQEFRTLQHAAAAMSQDSVVARTAEQLVRATDLALQELLTRSRRQ